MTTLDLLERAHAHLTELRDKSTPGPWVSVTPGLVSSCTAIHAAGHQKLTWDDHFGEVFEYSDADLIVTLHRTIDAQLKILAHDIDIYKQMVALGQEAAAEAAIWRAGDGGLARAILGEEA
ncbi:hypothetical protein [Mycetocola saprophilus]|uniref:hypothetical protein n=1 Tax=Mycetocola saprophilus TaxID=76636 RepID=UPI0004C128DB|nr:hypothetical protein [Mycetocola saprophilus]